MRKLLFVFVIFVFSLSVPLGFVINRTFTSLDQEELGQILYFSETIFDDMEEELATLIEKEENREVDYYSVGTQSSLSALPLPDYILGYLQNNPDGSFQSPTSQGDEVLYGRISEVNSIFNTKKMVAPNAPLKQDEQKRVTQVESKKQKTQQVVAAPDKRNVFEERYRTPSKTVESKQYLGKKSQRVEKISTRQALNIAQIDEFELQHEQSSSQSLTDSVKGSFYNQVSPERKNYTIGRVQGTTRAIVPDKKSDDVDGFIGFQVEVAPFQSVSIDDERVYVFRRIVIGDSIYRQGFVVLVEQLLQHLATKYYSNQPLASFTTLEIKRRDIASGRAFIKVGTDVVSPDFVENYIFPQPFDFLLVSLFADDIPVSPARTSLNISLGVLGGIMLLGLLAIYKSVRTIVVMSERRSKFVSSVTHELKTPLTNIRMYIEMLEQGIAATPEHEQEYLATLNSESTRLSGLINNVLELSKLEKKQRRFHLEYGIIEDLFSETQAIMAEKINQSGFTLTIEPTEIDAFRYDREVLIQILTNIIENSIKFGMNEPVKQITLSAKSEGASVIIRVKDTGPGIPKKAVKRVFDDFYRVDNDLTRNTGGTGIGLSLVKKFIEAMGGAVSVVNNRDAGCTFTLKLPNQ